MNHLRRAILTASALLAAPAGAATIGAASVDYGLDLPSFEGVLVERAPDEAETYETATGAATADAAAGFDGAAGQVAATSTVDGAGMAEAGGALTTGFAVENLGDAPIGFAFDLAYTLTASATGDGAEAVAHLSVLNDFSTLFERRLAFGGDETGADMLSGTETIALDLDGFDFDFVEVRTSVETGATALAMPAPIPLPASGWTLVAGLGALAAMRRAGSARRRGDV